MNKLFFSLLLLASTVFANDPFVNGSYRPQLTKAIIEADFDATVAALAKLPVMTPEEKQHYIDLTNQVIASQTLWLAQHHRHPEFGKESIKTFAYAIPTATCGSIIYIILDGIFNHNLTVDKKAVAVFLALLGIGSFTGYKTIKHAIAAWMKPSDRLANALCIKDLLFHQFTLKANTEGGYSTALGAAYGLSEEEHAKLQADIEAGLPEVTFIEFDRRGALSNIGPCI